MTDMNMEHFANALYTAHEYNAAVVHPSVRVDAENLLISLRESADGYHLACNILAAEPFDQIRAFWAFNTLIHHMNAVGSTQHTSAIATPEAADELYGVLAGWIRRIVVERALPDFILNKHAQTVVIGAYAFYPNNWQSFFDDLFEFNEVRERGGGDQVALYFLRVFEYIDEVVVDRYSQRSPQQRERDMAIKDIMREIAIGRAVDVWYNVLTYYHNRSADTGFECAQLCLRVLESYVEWIDVQLLLTPYWVNLLYFLISIHPLRVGACECLGQLVAKKQLPQVKMETLGALNVVEALEMLAPLVASQMPSTEEEEQFTLSVAWLMVSAAEHLQVCVDATTPKSNDMLRAVVPHVLSLLNLPLFSVRDAVLPFLATYCKWAPPDELQPVMEALFLQTCRPGVAGPLTRDEEDGEGDDGTSGQQQHASQRRQREARALASEGAPLEATGSSADDRNLTQRKQMYNAMRLVHRRNGPLVVSHCMYVVETVTTNEDPTSVPEGDAEGAVRYVYELAESVRLDQAFRPLQDGQQPSELATMIDAILQSRLIRENPSPLLYLAVVEMCDRCNLFFVHHRDHIGVLLELLLQSPNGIVNPNPRVRGRICYLFAGLVRALKSHMVVYVEPICNALSSVLTPADSGHALLPSDKADLYEALGSLLAAANDLGRCAEILHGIVDVAQAAAEQLHANGHSAATEGAVHAVADAVSYITSLAKGVGGIEATRMPDSPPMGPSATPSSLFPAGAASNTPAQNALAEAETAIASACEAARQDSSANVFLAVLEHVVTLCDGCLVHAPVRDKVLNFLQQLLNILGLAALPATELALMPMIRTCTVAECPRILRVMVQTVNKTKAASAIVMGRSLLPEMMERVASFGDVSELRADHNVISESARELVEVYREYFGFVKTLVNGAAISSLMHERMQPLLGILMESLLGAIRVPLETDLPKHALIAITRLTSAWCDPETTFESFLFDSMLPSLIDELTGGAIDLREGKAIVIIGELCQLLRAVAAKLEERGLYRLYSLLTGGQAWVSHSEANDFCGAIRQNVNARTTMPLRQATKQLLELVLTRRAQAAGAGGGG